MEVKDGWPVPGTVTVEDARQLGREAGQRHFGCRNGWAYSREGLTRIARNIAPGAISMSADVEPELLAAFTEALIEVFL
jgi:hypothetical protein